MLRWEYKTLYALSALDTFGREGWELVAIRKRYFLFIVIGEEFLMKRPLGDGLHDQLTSLAEQVQSLSWIAARFDDRVLGASSENAMLERVGDALFEAAEAFDVRAHRANNYSVEYTDGRPDLKVMYSGQFYLFTALKEALAAAGTEIKKSREI